MKKTKLLSLTALTLIGLLGISSCGSKGEKGDTGATGPAGETGPKGDKGDPGENGEDGKDGATWLTGTSKPADSLGNLGDMYLNTTNGDVYQKEESGWTLKMNIKGEDGEDGANGSSGSTGPKGETAYSNTILPSEGGYVIPSVGSATSGSSITFYIHTNEGYSFESLELNDPKVTTLTYDEDGVGSYETTMPTNGFVVKANFVSVVPGGDVKLDTSYFKDGYIYTGATLDAAGNVIIGGTQGSKMFESGSGTEEDPLEINSLETFKLIGNSNVVNSNALYFKLTNNISDLDTPFPISTREETHIDLNGYNISTSKDALKETSNNVTTNLMGEGVILDLFNGSTTKSKIEYNFTNDNSQNNTSAFLVKEGASLILNNISLSGRETGITCVGDASKIEIINSDVEGYNLGISTNASTSENYNPTIIVKDGSTISSVDGSAVLMNVPGTLTIENSTLTGQDQVLFARAGTTTISNSNIILKEEPSVTSAENYWQDPYYNKIWGSGNSAIRAGILVGNKETTGYDSDKVVTLNSVTFKDESKYLNHPLLCGYLSEKETQEGIEVSITLDKATLDNLDLEKLSLTNSKFIYEGKELTLGESVEIEGVTYSKALYYEENGTKVLVKGSQETTTNE